MCGYGVESKKEHFAVKSKPPPATNSWLSQSKKEHFAVKSKRGLMELFMSTQSKKEHFAVKSKREAQGRQLGV